MISPRKFFISHFLSYSTENNRVIARLGKQGENKAGFLGCGLSCLMNVIDVTWRMNEKIIARRLDLSFD